LVGAVLRFYGFTSFSYDEVSAGEFRLQKIFENHQMQAFAATGTGTIQVFLNYWRFIAGDSEAPSLLLLLMGMGWRLVFLIGVYRSVKL
jgi:hypothetical protein